MGKLARFARSPGLSFAALTPGTRSPAALSGTVARLWLAPGNRESGIGSRESGFWMNMGVQDLYYVGFWFIVVRVVFVKALEEVDVFVEAWVGWLSWKA